MSDIPVRRVATVTAITFVDLFVLYKSDFDSVLSVHPNLYCQIMESAQHNLKEAMEDANGIKRYGSVATLPVNSLNISH